MGIEHLEEMTEQQLEAVKEAITALGVIVDEIATAVLKVVEILTPIAEVLMDDAERWNAFDEATESKMS